MSKDSLSFEILRIMYIEEKRSVSFIAEKLGFSQNKVNYWLKHHNISKRSISEALYVYKNPSGDPFFFRMPVGPEEERLFGMGLALYWGEGNKANKNTIRIGNSDPNLILVFMKFLLLFFRIKTESLRFHLHLFSDINPSKAKLFWMQKLNIKSNQFYKPAITKSGALGTYRNKNKYSVLTLYYSNVKARNILMNKLQESSCYPIMSKTPL